MRILSDHKKPIACLALSTDGRFLAESAHGGKVRVWDLAADRVVHVLDSGGRFPNQVRVAFSPDGASLAVVNATVEVIDLATKKAGKYPTPLIGFACFNGVAFSPDGGQLVAGGHHFGWWDVKTRKPIPQPKVPEPTGEFDDSVWRCGAFSPDGTRLAYCRAGSVEGAKASVNEVFVFDAAKRSLIASFHWTGHEARRVLFSPDGKTLAAMAGNTLRAWDVKTGKETATVQGGPKHFMGAAFTPDGRFVGTVSKDKTTRFWDTTTWTEAKTFDWDIGPLLDIAFAPDGMTAAVGSERGKILLFDVG